MEENQAQIHNCCLKTSWNIQNAKKEINWNQENMVKAIIINLVEIMSLAFTRVIQATNNNCSNSMHVLKDNNMVNDNKLDY